MRLSRVWIGGWLLAVAAAAQVPGDSGKTITFDITVHAKNDHASFPLPSEAFAVLDNKRPVAPLAFQARKKGDEHVQVVIAVDLINIKTQWTGSVREQVVKFLRSQGDVLDYATAIAVVSDTSTGMSGFSLNGNKLADTLEKQALPIRERAEGGLYEQEDRMERSSRALMGLTMTAAKMKGRTAIIWVSPGWPYVSGPMSLVTQDNEDHFFQMVMKFSTVLRTSRVTLSALNPIGPSDSVDRDTGYEEFLKGVTKASQVQGGHLSVQVLAMQSGGRVENSNDVSMLLQRCYNDLHEYYEITIPEGPADKKNLYHHIEVKVNDPSLTVTARDGYYSEP